MRRLSTEGWLALAGWVGMPLLVVTAIYPGVVLRVPLGVTLAVLALGAAGTVAVVLVLLVQWRPTPKVEVDEQWQRFTRARELERRRAAREVHHRAG